ncbi:MAG TPA: FMN-binding protein [Gemmatimonadaceae bacterium]|nr:FMN-binding protein [Gemmatimonadaceae bacterium]
MSDDEHFNGKSAPNWFRSHLAALGSAAVISVYAAGYFRTEAAAAHVADDARDDASERRPVARTPIAPQEIAHTTTARDTTKVIHAPVTAAATAAATAAPAAPINGPATKAVAAVTKPATATTSPAVSDSPKPPKADSTPTAVSATPTTPAAPRASPAAADTASTNSQTAQIPPITDTSAAHVAYKDGVYSGYGTSRHGDIEATVEIKSGRIVSAMITQCLTQYSCSWISALPPQVVDRQTAEVDYVSGATQSSNAFYGAVVQALRKAK